MAPFEQKTATSIQADNTDFQNRFYCKLFDDMIIKSLCILRRRELRDRNKFSCSGCSKDRIMNSMRTLRRSAHS